MASEEKGALDPVDDWTERLLKEGQRGLRRFLRAVEVRVRMPLERTFATVARSHQAMLVSLDAKADPLTAWREVRAYRDRFLSEILEPVTARLSGLDAGQRIDHLWRAAHANALEIASTAPELVRRPERPTRFEPARDDGVSRRIGKRALAGGRRVGDLARFTGRQFGRVLGRAPSSPRDRWQLVPLRGLLLHHVAARVPGLEEPFLEAVRQRAASPIAAVEFALASHLQLLLETEVKLKRPEYRDSVAADGQGQLAPSAEETVLLVRLIESGAALTVTLDRLGAPTALAAPLEPQQPGAGALARDLSDTGSPLAIPTLLSGRTHSALWRSLVDRRRAKRTLAWRDWHRQVVTRAHYLSCLLHLRRSLESSLAILLDGASAGTIGPVRALLTSAAERLSRLREGISVALDRATDGGPSDGLMRILGEAQVSASALLGEDVVLGLDQAGAETEVRAPALRARAELDQALLALPQLLEMHVPTDPGEGDVDPQGAAAEVRLEDAADQELEGIGKLVDEVPTSLLEAIGETRTDAERLRSVIRFNLEAAADELRLPRGGEVDLDATRELAVSGLERSERSLVESAERLGDRLDRILRAAATRSSTGWDLLLARLRDERAMTGHVFDLRYRAARAVRASWDAVVYWGTRGWDVGRRSAQHALALARRLVRVGRTAVEGGQLTHAEEQRTLDALTSLNSVLADLPLVYSRLFGFRPVDDQPMLVGREFTIDEVGAHLRHWEAGRTDALVLTGAPGSGRTSVLNVLHRTLLAGARVRRLSLEARVTDENEFAGRLARELGFPTRERWTLVSLADALLERGRRSPSDALLLDDAEHLFLRSTSGNGLLTAFLMFLSRTDTTVFWLIGMSEHTWRHLERTDPMATAMVRPLALPGVDRDTVRSIIMGRHRLSGLPLVYQEPTPASPILRRRLGRAENDQQRQALLETDYFDQLTRASGSNVILAMFYWLRSAHLAPDGRLEIRPIEALSFGFLDQLVLAQGFALKAFFDHGTLTLEEHDRIFESTPDESRRIFESLGNSLVIEPNVGPARLRDFNFTGIADSSRYRVRPLLVHPVTNYLKARHLIY